MIRFTLQIEDDSLSEWIDEQARLCQRSRNKQIEHILSVARTIPIFNHDTRYILASPRMCNNGKHHFRKDDPANSDFCNCGVFVFGEVQ